MNIYLVVSEELRTFQRPIETYCIAELVRAKNASQARYLAWKNDIDSYTGYIKDMPKFQTRTKLFGSSGEMPGIVTDDFKYADYWWRL